jgi:hypothetical protein
MRRRYRIERALPLTTVLSNHRRLYLQSFDSLTQQHFARVFRQLCGSTPTEYRREFPGHVLPRALETYFDEHNQQV